MAAPQVTRLIDYVCERPGCLEQTTWPQVAATRGWFVVVDTAGRTVVVCPAHNNARSNR